MKKVSWDDQGQVPWSLSYANTGNTYGFRRKCKTDDKIGRKNAARLLKENGLHFSLKSFFVKKILCVTRSANLNRGILQDSLLKGSFFRPNHSSLDITKNSLP